MIGRLAWPSRWLIGQTQRHRFVSGLALGVVLVFVLRWAINEATLPDRLVSPLLETDDIEDSDAIVVMGAADVGNCSPNVNGVWRVNLAARLWREGRAPIILFNGGAGEPCPVAMAMARFARDLGIPESAVHLETLSQTTHENAEFSAPILQRLGAKRLLVVTDRLHMRRSVGSFTRLGFDVRRASVPVFLGHEDNVSMLSAAARESLALAYYRWRGWLGPAVEQRHVNTGFGASTANVQEPAFPDGPLVILGASYARGWDPKHIAGKDVRNVGIDGQQSFEMLARFDRDVIAARPRGVVLWGFINDIFRSQPQDLDAALARVRQSYADMVERARANGVEPVIATEVTLRPAGGLSNSIRLLVAHLRKKQSYQDRINRQVIAINVWLSDLAHREGLLLLDFQGALSDEHGRRRAEFIADDGSHITPAGYAALTDYAKPVLERHFTRAD